MPTPATPHAAQPLQTDALIALLLELSFARTLPDIAAVLRRRLRELVGADGITFVLRDGSRCQYVDEDAVGPLWKGQSFPMSFCISGWAMLNRQSVAIEDIYADPRIPHEAYRPTFVKSLAMVPIRADDPLGAIGAYWAVPRRATADELALMQTVADATSLAITNAYLNQAMQTTIAELDRRKGEAEQAAEERRRMLEQAERALAERNVLLREVHHRVKNNLQMMASMIRLIARQASRESQPILNDITRRIVTLGQAYNQLSTTDGLDRLDLAAYLRDVCAQALAAQADDAIRLRQELTSMAVDIDTALPLGLIASELITNALKHAFPDHRKGTVTVRLALRRGYGILTVRDTGVGLPDRETTALGIRLAEALAAQIDGRLRYKNHASGGAQFRLVFKRLNKQAKAA